MGRYRARHRLGGCPHRSFYYAQNRFVGINELGEPIYRCTRCGEIWVLRNMTVCMSKGRPRVFGNRRYPDTGESGMAYDLELRAKREKRE